MAACAAGASARTIPKTANIARYAREKGWILQSVWPGQEQMQKPGEVDGVICQLYPTFREHTRRVSALRVPRVELSHYNPRARLPRVEPDYVEAGRMVANHFLQNKFRHILDPEPHA